MATVKFCDICSSQDDVGTFMCTFDFCDTLEPYNPMVTSRTMYQGKQAYHVDLCSKCREKLNSFFKGE